MPTSVGLLSIEFGKSYCSCVKLQFGHILEYCAQFCLLCYTKNEVLERMQKRLSRRLPGLESVSPKEKLVRHGLFSLEQRRP